MFLLVSNYEVRYAKIIFFSQSLVVIYLCHQNQALLVLYKAPINKSVQNPLWQVNKRLPFKIAVSAKLCKGYHQLFEKEFPIEIAPIVKCDLFVGCLSRQEYECGEGDCVPAVTACDGMLDCSNAADEYCGKLGSIMFLGSLLLLLSVYCYFWL